MSAAKALWLCSQYIITKIISYATMAWQLGNLKYQLPTQNHSKNKGRFCGLYFTQQHYILG